MERFLERNWPVILVLMVALGGCGDAPEMIAFDKEYDWNKPCAPTPKYRSLVTFPSWLAEVDKPKVLAVIDSYIDGIITAYPKAAGFWWDNLRVYLHETVGNKIVCYYPAIWCWGWQLGERVYTPWRPQVDANGTIVGINPNDTFQVIPHEVFHLIGGWEIGIPSVGHEWIETHPAAQEAIAFARAGALRLELSQESVRGALARLPYIPWIEPGK